MLILDKKRQKNHGLTNTRLYRIYSKMKQRCYAPNNHEYKYYGGRGITICGEWLESFVVFYDWSMANGYDDTLTIDRIDTDKGYSPDNCRWVTMKIQSNNRRSNRLYTYKGVTKNIAEWASSEKVNEARLRSRLDIGWSFEDAISYKADARVCRRV